MYIIVYADKCQYDDEWLFLAFFTTSSHPLDESTFYNQEVAASTCYFVYDN